VSVVANVAINVDSRGATQKLREVQSQATATERAIGGLGGAIGKLAAAFSVIQAAKFVFVSTAEIESQTRSLQVLTGSAEKAGQIIKDLQQLGAATPFTSTELIDSAKRLQAFGVETNKVVETTRRLADVSGATGAELQGLVTAYGQVQAKGRLQGEELLQFQERGVALQQVLKEEYKLSGEEFQDALEKGRISAQAVEYAIQKLTAAGGKYADGAVAQSDTLAGRLSTLQDAVQNLASRLGSILAPAMQSILGLAIDIANQVNNVFETILLQRQLGANLPTQQRDKLFRQAGQEAEQIARLRGGRNAGQFGRSGAMIDQAVFNQIREERFRDLMRTYGYQQGILKPPTAAPPSAAVTLPGLMAATGGKGKKGKSDAEREAERLRKELERSLEIGDQLGTQFARQVMLLDESSELERKRLQIQFDFEDRAKQISELKNAEQQTNLTTLNDEIKRLDILKLQSEELKRQIEDYYKRARLTAGEALPGGAGAFRTDINLGPVNDAVNKTEELKKRFEELSDPVNMAMTGAQGIGSAFNTAFQSIITGAQSTQQALAGFFKSVGDTFVQMATEIIAQMVIMFAFKQLLGLFGGGGGGLFSGAGPAALPTGNVNRGINMFSAGAPSFFAKGGFVTGPTSALIGEGGEPEYVIPASKMRGAMSRYASGARGSSVIPAGGEGGDMSSGTATMAPAAIDVRYTVERINSVDYVTADQFQAGMQQAAAQGAERGQQLALRRLQQSPSTRRRVGI
jgi:tape measure domain-containing protein